MVKLEHVNKKFGRKEILKDISCELENGIYGLLGPNGAGKTTLMRCMTDLYKLTSGEILINDISSKNSSKNRIGYLPQFFGLYKNLTVMDTMRFYCSLKKIKKSQWDTVAEKSLCAVNLWDKRKVPVRKLSGGMIRRVGVAQALINEPELLLFDEPTAGLDPEERMNFKRILSGLGENETVIISTHIVEDIEACCNYVIVMNEGTILGVLSCEELKQCAVNKVYCCQIGEEEKIEGNYVIEKQFEMNDKVYYRILANEENAHMKQLEPTLEDGYMCLIKGI